ncbi:MAG: GTP-binding protein [Thermoplasmata archaeon]|nr:MAG: GTP-binding protein [Thermoplasmata archaeon]
MPDAYKFKFKICLMGANSVGKTSLIRRYVFAEYEDKYIKTIGTKITKKKIEIPHPNNGGLYDIQLHIWDIMGDKGFRELLKEAYFYGSQGIIAICDVTKRASLPALYGWMITAQSIVGDVPVVFLGNKADLANQQQVALRELESFASKYDKSQAFLSSAKTGLNVELAFRTLSEKLAEEALNPPNP